MALAEDAPVIKSLSSGSPAALLATQAELSTLARSKNSPAAFVADLRGRTVALYPSQPELTGQDFSYRDWFKGVSRTGKPYVWEAYRSAANSHPLVVAVAASVADGSRRVGYVIFLWSLESVRSLSEGAHEDDGLTITMTELEMLRQRGVRVAIDDFGTAYATLQNLTTLPADVLKVDASFTAGLPDQRAHAAVGHGIASTAHELDIPCIVEGVETKVQLAALKGMAVQAQGWLWGKPQGPERTPTIG